jgi:hypothetical protein
LYLSQTLFLCISFAHSFSSLSLFLQDHLAVRPAPLDSTPPSQVTVRRSSTWLIDWFRTQAGRFSRGHVAQWARLRRFIQRDLFSPAALSSRWLVAFRHERKGGEM